ncbi:MAG: 3-hydroxyacyl-CoA dehydrogenase [Pseudomonadota bacterium]
MSRPAVVGVVGAGVMGAGIAQLFAAAGSAVRLFDTFEGAAEKARVGVAGRFARLAEKGRLDPAEADAASERVSVVDELAGLAGCELLVEAVVEDLEIKQSLFASLEALCGPETVLASNTSSLQISEIAARCERPERFAGLHFFNPVPLMKVVEVIPGVHTDPQVVDTLCRWVVQTGHQPVVAADRPGFIVNHAGRGFITEGLRIVDEGVADVVDVDRVMREAGGFRLGPFELLDLTGLDVSGKVMTSVYEQFFHEPRFRPSASTAPRVAAGLFGRKTGAGFYRYPEGRQEVPEERTAPLVTLTRVWLEPPNDSADPLAALLVNGGAELVAQPDDAELCVLRPLGRDATSSASALGLDLARCVAIDTLTADPGRLTLMLTVSTVPAVRDAAHGLLASGGTPVTVINDSPGFVLQRTLATIVNIGCELVQQRIATPSDLDKAVKLGLGYPFGPLAFGDQIGPERILTVLRNLLHETGDPRYRPSRWLTRRVAAGLSLLAPDAPRSAG